MRKALRNRGSTGADKNARRDDALINEFLTWAKMFNKNDTKVNEWNVVAFIVQTQCVRVGDGVFIGRLKRNSNKGRIGHDTLRSYANALVHLEEQQLGK